MDMPPPPLKKESMAAPMRRPQQQQRPQQEDLSGTLPKEEMKYTPPAWSGALPDKETYFEVMREGSIVETIPLNGKEYLIVGRDKRCHIVMEHPTISRQHAVIQLTPKGEVLLFDLGSVHGTFWNVSQEVPKKEFTPVKQGDMIHFGASTRRLILCGGVDTAEEIDNKKGKAFRENQLREAENASKASRDKAIMKALERNMEKRQQQRQEFLDRIHSDDHEDETGGQDDKQDMMYFGKAKKKTRTHADDLVEGFDDDDEFYDRSGLAKKKRDKKAAKGKPDKIITHSEKSVREALEQLEDDISDLKVQISSDTSKQANSTAKLDSLDDPLEAYVHQVALADATKSIAKNSSMLKTKLEELRVQEALYEKVRPALDGLVPQRKRKVFGDEAPQVTVTTSFIPKQKVEKQAVAQSSVEPAEKKTRIDKKETRVDRKMRQLEEINAINAAARARREEAAEAQKQPQKPVEKKIEQPAEPEEPQQVRRRERNPHPEEEDKWAPPTGQTGDGKTSLNEKYGY